MSFQTSNETRSANYRAGITECRKQPIRMFVDGGTLCGKCGREVANACERSWLNDKWAEAQAEDEERA